MREAINQVLVPYFAGFIFFMQNKCDRKFTCLFVVYSESFRIE